MEQAFLEKVISLIEAVLQQNHLLKQLTKKVDALQEQGKKIMAEIDDLQAALDAQGQAITDFTTTLDAGVAAINTEIAQLAAAVQSATDLAALKTAVTAATGRVTSATGSISTASATLQSEIDALNADDTPPTP